MTEDEDEDVDVENDEATVFDDVIKVCSGKEEDLVDIERLDGGTDLSDNCGGNALVQELENNNNALNTGIDTLGSINYQTFPDIFHENSNQAIMLDQNSIQSGQRQNGILEQNLLIDPTVCYKNEAIKIN